MDLPPEPVLEAAIYMGMVFARNCTLQHTPATAKQANDFMEAMHTVPTLLTHWSQNDVDILRIHFGCYHHTRWEGGPDLVRMFDEKLAELSS